MFGKKVSWIAMMAMISVNAALGQITNVREYKIGDTLPPDFEFGEVMNASQRSYNLSDFKGKLVILDFWATWCGTCIHAMPKMGSLQQQFKDKVMILPVTTESDRERVEKFWKENDILKSISLPSIVKGSPLKKSFEHGSIPFEVWIRDGIVIGMTDEEHVNAKEIEDVLSGKQKNWPVFVTADYDLSTSFMQKRADLGWSSNKRNYYVAVLPYLKQAKTDEGRLRIDNREQCYIYWGVNRAARQLYTTFLKLTERVSPNRVFYDTSYAELTSEGYKNRKTEYSSDWEEQYSVCLDLKLPLSMSKQEIGRKVIEDLNTYLSLDGKFEIKEMDCYVIKDDLPAKRKINPPANVKKKNAEINFKDIDKLIYMLNGADSPVFILEVKDKKQFDGTLTFSNVDDFNVFCAEMKDYGLSVRKEKRNLEVFTVKKKPSAN